MKFVLTLGFILTSQFSFAIRPAPHVDPLVRRESSNKPKGIVKLSNALAH